MTARGPRRAMAPETWKAVRKDTSSAATSAALGDTGKAPAAQGAESDLDGKKAPVPPVVEAEVEEVKLPRKSEGKEKCACETAKDGSKKCACSVAKGEIPVGTAEDIAKAEAKKPGVMLALWAPDHVAKKLARPGGEPADKMHVTLGYYGKVGSEVHEDHLPHMEKCVSKAAETYKPIDAVIGGVGRFNASASSDSKDVLIAHIDSPGLHDLRDHLISEVSKCGDSAVVKAIGDKSGAADGPADPSKPLLPFRNHGYTPHMTIAYIEPDSAMPIHKLERDEFTFTHLVMAVGDKHKMFALGEREGATKKMWCPILKADDSERLATGIVLQPETVDAQGDIYDANVIKKAAHGFLALYNKKTQLGLQHEVFGGLNIHLVESWLVPVEMELNKRILKPGTWMMTVRVDDDATWNLIKTGKITGFSIGGVAKVRRLAM